MSTVRYLNLLDPQDNNAGLSVGYSMFGSGLVRQGDSTTYEITGAGGTTLVFRGAAFTYDGKGRLDKGHATSFEIRSDGELLATVTDIDVSASKLRALNSSEKFFDLLGKIDAEGSDGRDVIVGGQKGDVLRGGDADDFMVGGNGDDKIFGGDGNDGIFIGKGKGAVDGGAGYDFVAFADGADLQGENSPDLRIDLRDGGYQKIGGGATLKLTAVENILGGDGDDRLTGDGQANTISGEVGNDTVIGGAGDDTIGGGRGNDVLQGGSGEDTLNFNSAGRGVTVSLSQKGVQNTGEGKDKISGFEDLDGGAFNDKLIGNANSNHIAGGNGDDTIIGGGGLDGLEGGSGADVFLFTKASLGVSNKGEILDFKVGEDLMDLSKIDANANLGGDQDFTFIGTAAFTGAASQLRWSYFGNDPTRDILISGDLNGDKIADFIIQLRSPVSALSGSDFDF